MKWEKELSKLPNQLYSQQPLVTKNRVYLLGGYMGGVDYVDTVYTAPINMDGTLGEWVLGPALPDKICRPHVIKIKNRVYLLGGYNGKNHTSTGYVAKIKKDGSLSDWVKGPSLPNDLFCSQVVVNKNNIYLLGGYNGKNWVTTVYTTSINSDGTIGDWVLISLMPTKLAYPQCVVIKNKLYLAGGYYDGVYYDTVYAAKINSTGTLDEWTIENPLPIPLCSSRFITKNNFVYLLGGFNDDIYVSKIYKAPINKNGTLGDWVLESSFPAELNNPEIITLSDRMYVIGVNKDDKTSLIYSAVFSE